MTDSCSHVFCFGCLKEWRKTKEKDAEQVQHAQTCPACRTPSKLVTPSNWFMPNGAAKDKAVERYKVNMKKKPCQLLLNSPEDKRWCPFGVDCFYSQSVYYSCCLLCDTDQPRNSTLPDGETVTFTHTHADSIEERTRRRELREARRDDRLTWRQHALFRDVARALRYSIDSDGGSADDESEEDDYDSDTDSEYDSAIDELDILVYDSASDSSASSDSSESDVSSSSSSSEPLRHLHRRHSTRQPFSARNLIAVEDDFFGIQDGDSTDTIQRAIEHAGLFEDERASSEDGDSSSDGERRAQIERALRACYGVFPEQHHYDSSNMNENALTTTTHGGRRHQSDRTRVRESWEDDTTSGGADADGSSSESEW